MDRELLLEIGCEELPAAWLPDLTTQVADVVARQLREHRLAPASPVESFSTPRRLAVRVARVPERQTDLEELVTGPPVSAGFTREGAPTPAALGFAGKHGVDVSALEHVATPKGEYLAVRRRQRGRAAIDVLPSVLGGALRAMTFPKPMHWDAALDDGRGELPFGRPIRWILFLYGGRVVPFTITRSPAAQTPRVQDVVSGAVTYGHRFLTTTGRAGRAIKVRSFQEYRARLLEHFVILERADRRDKIVRELDAKAVRLKGRVSRAAFRSGLLDEVPDLVEYPSVVAGTFAPEFTESLPEEVLTTALIHHQHYSPVEDEEGRLKPAFLAVVNTEPDNERSIAQNAERVVVARLRDALFFWEADRRVPLESRLDRLATLAFHAQLGTYRDKAGRMERLAAALVRRFGGSGETAALAARAARLAKADLATDMVREFTELQGTMGGIYARAEGLPEEVWKAIFFHYLPSGVEFQAPPTRAELGRAALTWAAVSLADKLDTLVGLFAAGERPTGSRDPFGLRRAAQGVVKVLADLPALCGVESPVALGPLLDDALAGYGRARPAPDSGDRDWWVRLGQFLAERVRHLLEVRGAAADEINATVDLGVAPDDLVPAAAWPRASAVAAARRSPEFEALAELFKRVKNISKGVAFTMGWPALAAGVDDSSTPAAEAQLVREVVGQVPTLDVARARGDYAAALRLIAGWRPFVARYFDEVLVMDPDALVRARRLQLMAGLRDLVTSIADISAIAPAEPPSADPARSAPRAAGAVDGR